MRKRNKRVDVYFTDKEYAAVKTKAERSGLTIGGFIRLSVANKKITPLPDVNTLELIRLMRCAANNVNQTLKKLYGTGVADLPQFRQAFDELRKATKFVTDSYSMGGR